MTLSHENSATTNRFGIRFDTNAKCSTKLISNGGSFIELSQSKKIIPIVSYNLHGILMKMRSTISWKIGSTEATFIGLCCRQSNKKSSILLMKIHIFLLITTLLTCASLCITRATAHTMKYSSNVVKTKYGELRGIVVRNNPTVEAYLGVPYATPPVGSLR